MYVKDQVGLIYKEGRPDERYKSLPGLPDYDYNYPEGNLHVDPNAMDSEELAETGITGPVLPKVRYKPHCCQSLKEIDLYGI